jgi:hypothetical protein
MDEYLLLGIIFDIGTGVDGWPSINYYIPIRKLDNVTLSKNGGFW